MTTFRIKKINQQVIRIHNADTVRFSDHGVVISQNIKDERGVIKENILLALKDWLEVENVGADIVEELPTSRKVAL